MVLSFSVLLLPTPLLLLELLVVGAAAFGGTATLELEKLLLHIPVRPVLPPEATLLLL